MGEWRLWQVAKDKRGAGGDNPLYIQHMFDWMMAHNVYMECYFETPRRRSVYALARRLPKKGQRQSFLGNRRLTLPEKYRQLFGGVKK